MFYSSNMDCCQRSSWTTGGLRSALSKWCQVWADMFNQAWVDTVNTFKGKDDEEEPSQISGVFVTLNLTTRERLWIGLLVFPHLLDTLVFMICIPLLVLYLVFILVVLMVSIFPLVFCKPGLCLWAAKRTGGLVLMIVGLVLFMPIRLVFLVITPLLAIFLLPVSYCICGTGDSDSSDSDDSVV